MRAGGLALCLATGVASVFALVEEKHGGGNSPEYLRNHRDDGFAFSVSDRADIDAGDINEDWEDEFIRRTPIETLDPAGERQARVADPHSFLESQDTSYHVDTRLSAALQVHQEPMLDGHARSNPDQIAHVSHLPQVILPFDGAPECRVDPHDAYSCALTYEDQQLVKKHLDRRGVVAFILILGLVVGLWFGKWLFRSIQRATQDTRYFNMMFIKTTEQMTMLGLVIGFCILLESQDAFWGLDESMFPDKDRARWDIDKYATHDYREGAVHPEIQIMFEDMHLFVAMLMFIYVSCICFISMYFNWKFRKWHRFEMEAENEVHINDDPLEKVSFLLWRRSVVSPMLGQRAEELNQLRDAVAEFDFVAYLQEVLAQYMDTLFHIPTMGLFVMLVTAGIECFLNMQTRAHSKGIVGLALCIWTWTAMAIVAIFHTHLGRILRLLTPPPAALLWYLDHDAADAPDKHLLPPYRLIPYLKEAPKKTKFFYWWYGTFSPNQHEQLFFRWRKGPAHILGTFQVILFIMSVFFTVLLRHFFYMAPKMDSQHFWYPMLSGLAFAITVFRLMPEAILKLLLTTSIGLLPNKKAIHAILKDHTNDHWELSVQLLEMAQVASIKEQLENPRTQDQYKRFLQELFTVIFTEDEIELFEAAWKIHNWNQSRGMNPSELKECMEHLGVDDSEMVIGEWWLVFDSQGVGSLTHNDFLRMLVARHMIKHGHISVDDLQKLFEVHPNGDRIHQYNRSVLSEYLASFRIGEPRLGAMILIREARFMADEKAGKSDVEIQLAMSDMENCLVTPAEIAQYLHSKQNYRVKFDQKFIDHVKERRQGGAGAESFGAPEAGVPVTMRNPNQDDATRGSATLQQAAVGASGDQRPADAGAQF